MKTKKIVNILKKQILKIDDLCRFKNESEFKGWIAKTQIILSRINGKKSYYVKNFNESIKNILNFELGAYDEELNIIYKQYLKEAKNILENIVDELEELGLPNQSKKTNDIMTIQNLFWLLKLLFDFLKKSIIIN